MESHPEPSRENSGATASSFTRFWAGWAVDVVFIPLLVIIAAVFEIPGPALFVSICIVAVLWVAICIALFRTVDRPAQAENTSRAGDSAV